MQAVSSTRLANLIGLTTKSISALLTALCFAVGFFDIESAATPARIYSSREEDEDETISRASEAGAESAQNLLKDPKTGLANPKTRV